MRYFFLLAAAILVAMGGAGAAQAVALKPCAIPNAKGPLLCGTFVVPENYEHPRRRQLPLKLIVVPSETKPAKEPVLLLAGGPGGAVTEEAGDISSTWLRKEHDVVLLDMRGTGEGTKLDCDLGKSAARPEQLMEPLLHEGTRYAACAKELSKKADLTQYTSTIAMRDLDDLRKVLGYGKINLWGGSYGTRAAMVYLHLYPQNARSAILSGMSPMDERGPLDYAAAAERSLELVLKQCAEDTACHKAFPDPRGDLNAVVAALKIKPAIVTLNVPPTGKPAQVPLTVSAFTDSLRVMLYDTETERRIPLLLSRARSGDFSEFANVALHHGVAMKESIAMGLLLSVTCNEELSRINPKEIPGAVGNSFIGDYRVRGQMAACSVWPTGPIAKDFDKPFTTDVPVLIISGNLDPVTPPHWGEDAKRYFPNSLHVIAPGGHVSYNNCLDRVKQQFLATASVKGLDASCIVNEKLPPFALFSKT